MMTALTIRPFIAIVLAASGFAAADLAPVLSSDGEGGLRKDGKPFRAIGVNYFSCFYRTLLDGADTSYEQGFEVLAREGIPFVRFAATRFWPKDMRFTAPTGRNISGGSMPSWPRPRSTALGSSLRSSMGLLCVRFLRP